MRNSIIDASESFPETFTVEIRPIRATVEAPAEVEPGEEFTVTVTFTGSTLISYSTVIAGAALGAQVTGFTPSSLGFGREHVVTVTATASEDSVIFVALIARLVNTYTLGFDFGPYEFQLIEVPGVVVVPIEISVQG